MKKKTNLEVHYACDSKGDHTANMAECIDSNIKKFDTIKEKELFISECTYVYNLDIALGAINSKSSANPVLDCLEESCI